MTADFQSKMTTARYRRVTTLLNELNDYLRIATTAGCTDLAESIGQIVAMFESGKKDAFLARGQRKKVVLDNHGRSYTVGKRKTSAARVWMIPVQVKSPPTIPQPEESIEELFGIQSPSPPPVTVTTTTVLVNNIPLAEYFPIPADRERIIRPFKVAGVLGAYNVFAIVRGGGSTGQSGALAHGIAKGLVAHEPELDKILRRGSFLLSIAIPTWSSITLSAKLLRRDPRMVERKKTGLAKARKRVRAFAFLQMLMILSKYVSSIPGSNDDACTLIYVTWFSAGFLPPAIRSVHILFDRLRYQLHSVSVQIRPTKAG